MPAIFDLVVAIKADIDDFHKGMATARETVGIFDNAVENVGRTMRRMGTIITASSAVAAAGIGVIVNEAHRVDNAFREIDTLLGSTGASYNAFGEDLRSVSEEFGVQGGLVNTVGGAYQALSSGIEDTAKVTDFMADAARLSGVGLTDMETSVDVLTTVINAYNLEAEDSAHISNQLFTIVDRGKVRFDELARSIGPLISVAAQFGIGMDQVGASMQLLTKQGFSARRATFAVRSAILEFIKPSKAMKEVLREIALEYDLVDEAGRQTIIDFQNQQAETRKLQMEFQELTADLNELKGEFDNLSDSMRDNRIEIMEIRLRARKEGRELTEEEKAQIDELELANDELRLSQLKLERQMDNVNEKRDQSRKKIEESQAATEKLDGKIDQMADSMGQALLENEDLSGAISILSKEAEELGIPLEQVFDNVRALQFIYPLLKNDMADFNTELRAQQEDLVDVNKTWEEVIKNSFGNQVQTAINNLRNLLVDLGRVMKDDLTIAFKNFGEFVGEIAERFNALPESTQQAIGQFVMLATAIGLVLGPALIVAGVLLTLVGTLGMGGIAGVAGLAAGAVLLAAKAFQDMKEGGDGTKEVIGNLTEFVKNAYKEFQEFYRVISNNLIPAFSNLIKAVGSVIGEMLDLVGAGENSSEVYETVKNTIFDLIVVVSDATNKLANFIQENDRLIAKGLVVGGAIAGIAFSLDKLVTGLIAAKAALTGFKGASSVAAFAAGKFSTEATLVGTIVARLGAALPGLASILTVVKGAFTAVAGVISGLSLPVLIAIGAAVAVAIAAFVAFRDNLYGFRDTVMRVFGVIRDVIEASFGFIVNDFILPLLEELTSVWNDRFGMLEEEFRQTFQQLKTVVVGVVGPVFKLLIDIANTTLDILIGIWDTWGNEITLVLKFVADTVITILGGLLDFLLTGIGIALDILQGDWEGAWNKIKGLTERIVGGVVNWLEQTFNGLKNYVANDLQPALWGTWTLILRNVKNILGDVANYIKNDAKNDIINAIIDITLGIIGAFVGLATDLIGASIIPEMFMDIVNYISTTAKQRIISAIDGLITGFLNSVSTGADKIYTTFRTKTNEWFSWVKTKYNEIDGWIRRLFTNLWNRLDELFNRWVTGFQEKLNSWDQNVRETYRKFAQSAKDEFRQLWNDLITALSNWITKFRQRVTSWSTDIVSRVTDFGQKLRNEFTTLFNNVITELTTWVTTYTTRTANWITDISSRVSTFAINLLSEFRTLFTNILTELGTWVSNTTSDFVAWIADISSKMATFASNLLQDFITLFNNIVSELATWITNTTTDIQTFFRDVQSWISSTGNSLWTGAFDTVKTAVEGVIDKLVTSVTQKIEDLVYKGRDFIRGTGRSAWQSAWDAVVSAVESVLNSIDTSGVTSALNDVISLAQDTINWLDNIPRSVTTTVTTIKRTIFQSGGGGGGGGGSEPTTNPSGRDTGASGGSTGGSSGGSSGGGSSGGPSGGVIGDPIEHLQHGGIVTAREMPALLHGPEAVIPLDRLESWINTVAMGVSHANTMGSANPIISVPRSSGMGQINISEGAIKIEKGAFKGVAEEDLPEKVGEQMETELYNILEKIRSQGR